MSLLGGMSSGFTGDIWSTGAFSFESPLKDLLDSENYTLEQLLAEDELLQELRGIHPTLIEYFSTEQAVTKLIKYLILPPLSHASASKSPDVTEQQNGGTVVYQPKDPGQWLEAQKDAEKDNKTNNHDPEIRHIRFPFMACEIICCEIPSIVNTLVDGHVVDTIEPSATSKENSTLTGESSTGDETVTQPPQEASIDASSFQVEVVSSSTDSNNNAATTTTSSSSSSSTRILDLLFSVLTNTKEYELDDYRAGYFEKILRVLFKLRSDDMVAYVNKGGFVEAIEDENMSPAPPSPATTSKRRDMIQAFVKHLYSHSIMQVLQRLLLPQRPVPKLLDDEEAENGEEKEEEEDENNILTGPDMEENDTDDQGGEIQSDWSKTPEALSLLLDCLMPDKGPDLTPEQEERLLDMSLNASEVLITVIQNSMLSSETMLMLTETKQMERIIRAAGTCPEDEYFSPHQSFLTSAMNVLESLILQLGGYGVVGTMTLLDENTQQQSEDEEGSEQHNPLIADLSSLVEHLPLLLDLLSGLLQHPSTLEWTEVTQFSKTEAQPMLGGSRLRIVRVLESLVLLGDYEVDSCLVQSDCLEICLNLFWDFQWCSMLHQSVANLLVHVFEGRNARVDMQEYFLIRCNILVRLMDSFLESETINSKLSIDLNNTVGGSSDIDNQSFNRQDSNVSGDRLPVSEDDVDAAMEQAQENEAAQKDEQSAKIGTDVSTEAVHNDSRQPSESGVVPPPQTFRFGYMGHVIIICQALVHATTNDVDEEDEQMKEPGEASNPGDSMYSQTSSAGESEQSNLSKEPLFLAEMVACHPLSDKWNDFVATTLASETTTQTTPLGGLSMAGDSLHGRPGLADDGDLGLGGFEGALPPRGMLAGGDVIDMDDNDLDMAANMMAGLSMGRSPGGDGDDDSSGGGSSGNSDRSYNSGETNNSGGYLFDDPLGKLNGGLGIELGKLTKYNPANDKKEDQEGDDEGSNHSSSSDEEPDRRESESDVPVMDLFAGNFDYGTEKADSNENADAGQDWSNFANFDDAFAASAATEPPQEDGDDDFGPFAGATEATTEEPKASAKNDELEDIFGGGDHADLLEADSFEDTPSSAIVADSDVGTVIQLKATTTEQSAAGEGSMVSDEPDKSMASALTGDAEKSIDESPKADALAAMDHDTN